MEPALYLNQGTRRIKGYNVNPLPSRLGVFCVFHCTLTLYDGGTVAMVLL